MLYLSPSRDEYYMVATENSLAYKLRYSGGTSFLLTFSYGIWQALLEEMYGINVPTMNAFYVK